MYNRSFGLYEIQINAYILILICYEQYCNITCTNVYSRIRRTQSLNILAVSQTALISECWAGTCLNGSYCSPPSLHKYPLDSIWSHLGFSHQNGAKRERSPPGGALFACASNIKMITFTFMHLADAFIQSDLQCIQAIHVLSVCVFPGNRTHNLLRC